MAKFRPYMTQKRSFKGFLGSTCTAIFRTIAENIAIPMCKIIQFCLKKWFAQKTTIAAITEGGITNLNECFDEIRRDNPAKFVELYLRLLEYTMPKLRSIDNNIDLSDSLIQKITVEVNAKRPQNTSDDSIPE